jgi:hypothetical protein
MDNLLDRADLAISDSRRIRSEVHHGLAEARVAVKCARKLLQWARTENERMGAKLVEAHGALQHNGRAVPGASLSGNQRFTADAD